MNRVFIWISWLCFPVFSQAQSDETDRFRRVELGLAFAPDYNYRVLQSDADAQAVADFRNDQESFLFSFSYGLNVSYRFNERLALRTAAYRRNKGYMYRDIVFTDVSGNTTGTGKLKYHYRYVEVPLIVRYMVWRRGVHAAVTAGPSVNFYQSRATTGVVRYNDGTEEEIDAQTVIFNMNNPIPGLILGLGVEKNLFGSMHTMAELQYRRSLTRLAEAPLREYHYAVGLLLGAFWRL